MDSCRSPSLSLTPWHDVSRATGTRGVEGYRNGPSFISICFLTALGGHSLAKYGGGWSPRSGRLWQRDWWMCFFRESFSTTWSPRSGRLRKRDRRCRSWKDILDSAVFIIGIRVFYRDCIIDRVALAPCSSCAQAISCLGADLNIAADLRCLILFDLHPSLPAFSPLRLAFCQAIAGRERMMLFRYSGLFPNTMMTG